MKKIILLILVAVAIGGWRWYSSAHSDGTAAGGADRQSAAVSASGLEIPEIPGDIPSVRRDYTGFTLSYNPHNRTANWVGWELLASETGGSVSRSNNFWQDPEVTGCPTTDDYRRSGYDRGHLCPAADQKWSPQAMEDCFVMTNMCPQDHSLNSGAWSTLEKKERLWAQRDGRLIIVAGPIYKPSDTTTIGTNRVRVPSAFFKALLAPDVDSPRAIAFVYPNMSSPGNMRDYCMTIDELEALTGYDFFPALPDELENAVEAVTSFKEWNSTR